MAKMPQPVREYLRRVGLDAWAVHFQTHLPTNCTSVAKVRATTAPDLWKGPFQRPLSSEAPSWQGEEQHERETNGRSTHQNSSRMAPRRPR